MMKLTECNLCALSKLREHTSFPKGIKPSSVFILFDREPKLDSEVVILNEFMRKLSVYLHNDYYYTFAVKCYQTQVQIKLEHALKCREWLKTELKSVNPYLIVIMGDLSKVSVLGKIARFLKPDIFYVDKSNAKKKEIFIGNSIYDNVRLVEGSLSKLLSFIKEYYKHE
jgi:hypothetical protein